MNNEKDIFYKLVEKAKEVSLSEREKIVLFKAVDSFVEKNPIKSPSVTTTGTTTSPQKGMPSFVSHWHMYGMRFGAFAMLALIISGGTSFAAKNALPGDFLYPIRVNFNEEVKSAFLTGVQKSQYEVERVKNRVAEINQLAAENKLSSDIKGTISVRLDSHVAQVQKDILALNQKGDLKSVFEISSNLEKTLDQGNVENSAAASSDTPVNIPIDTRNDHFVSINDIIKLPYKTSVVARETAENQILARNTNDDDARLIALAKFDVVKKSFEIIDNKISSDQAALDEASTSIQAAVSALSVQPKSSLKSSSVTPAKIKVDAIRSRADSNFDARLKIARELFAEGQAKLAAQEYTDAFGLFKDAHSITMAIQLEMNVNSNTKSDMILDQTN